MGLNPFEQCSGWGAKTIAEVLGRFVNSGGNVVSRRLIVGTE